MNRTINDHRCGNCKRLRMMSKPPACLVKPSPHTPHGCLRPAGHKGHHVSSVYWTTGTTGGETWICWK